MESTKVIAIAGNPNVGKSTLFNGLTGMKQHTGNWTGKTVANAHGYCKSGNHSYLMADIPGTYSLAAHSKEEEVARDFLCSGEADAVIVVCDATCLERNLNLALQIREITPKVMVCVNLLDEAKRKHIHINLEKLSELLGVPVVGTVAREKKSRDQVLKALDHLIDGKEMELLKFSSVTDIVKRAEEICSQAVYFEKEGYAAADRKIDAVLTSKWIGYPVMLLLLAVILWITITGANYPSELLADYLFRLQGVLLNAFHSIGAPQWMTEALVLGVYRVLAWVVSVMLPPMAIFFPLFTLLEDVGYLPRVAYNLDKPFKCCSACGKQGLTMCMGFGCNAVGVTGCRIIDSPRERMIAMLTNCFVPCNGRFPALIAIITMFFVGEAGGFIGSFLSALLLTAVILFGILMTFVVSSFLSRTVLKGLPSSFVLELPPYRRPQVLNVIVRSIFDRTLFVLGRAAAVAAPAGLFIWILANVTVEGRTLLACCTGVLDPLGHLLGMDGVILMAFILGFPANEIVIPVMIMAYMAQGSLGDMPDISSIHRLFADNGWTGITAVCFMMFSLMHWPCSTTCLTLKKETGNIRWTAAAILIPTVCGMVICFCFHMIARLIIS